MGFLFEGERRKEKMWGSVSKRERERERERERDREREPVKICF